MSKALTTRETALARVKGKATRLRSKYQRAAQKVAQFDRVALFDSSGSMNTADAYDRQGLPSTRWNALLDAWTEIAPLAKGRLAAYVFSCAVDPVRGSATGQVLNLPYQGGSTSMCAALREACKYVHPDLRVLLVSDGEPTDGDPIPIAATLGHPVDCVYVGSPSGAGKKLLREIARVSGGTFLDMAGKFDATRFLEHCTKVLQLEE